MKKIIEKLNKLKLWQQILLVVAIIGIGFYLFFVNTRPDGYYLLFSELNEKEAAEIGNELAVMGIDYRMENENKTIQIKTPDVAKVRMDLASKGLPNVSGAGFELFDDNQLGASSFENDVNYTRALTGTIQKNLVSGIEGVESAQVQIPLIEKKRFFESDEEELTATIIVEEKANHALTDVQVQGIQNFVAGAVKNLTPKNVTVLNSKGEIISENTEDGSSLSGGYGKQEEIKFRMEERIRQDITKTLSSVFGYDNIKLTIRTDINFDEIVQNIEKYDPEGTLVSKQESNEKVTQSTEPEPEVGMESNGDVADYEMQGQTNGSLNSSEKAELIENFEVGKTVETIRKNPELQHILVSVYVDETQVSIDKLTDLQESVALSAGLIDKDKDGEYDNGAISVKTYEFKKVAVEEPTAEEEPKNFVSDNKVLLVAFVLLAIIILILVSVIVILSNKKKKEKMEQLHQMELLKAEKTKQQDDEELLPEMEASMTKEEKIRHRLLQETLKKAQEDTDKTIEYVRKSINER